MSTFKNRIFKIRFGIEIEIGNEQRNEFDWLTQNYIKLTFTIFFSSKFTTIIKINYVLLFINAFVRCRRRDDHSVHAVHCSAEEIVEHGVESGTDLAE